MAKKCQKIVYINVITILNKFYLKLKTFFLSFDIFTPIEEPMKTEEPVAKHGKKQKVHKNFLEEYNSRQKPDSLWLPTHIWFAKRFHMKKLWGYQLAFQATGKRFRSSYFATLKRVLAQDLSYFCCIELKGDEENLLSKLSCLTDDSLGMNFASESYIDGTKEGSCFLYHPNSYPFNGIGPVSFLWKPCINMFPDNGSLSNSCRQLWIWCHPSIHDELIQVLISVFDLKEKENSKLIDYKFASQTNYIKTKLHFQKEPVYVNEDVTMTDLKDTLVRHRIIGPNALSVITSVLNPVNQNDDLYRKILSNSGSLQTEDVVKKSSESSAVSNKEQLSLGILKRYVWNCLKKPESAYSVPLKTVIGLTVDDPRIYAASGNNKLNYPKDNIVAYDANVLNDVIDEFSKPAMAFSALWDREIRNEVTASQIHEIELNEERAKYIIPHASSELKKCTTSVPVIVIQQPHSCGFGSGWDVIAPLGWGMAFWIPFVYHKAQPAGFDDFCSVNWESGLPTFPCSFPDTKAGYDYEESSRENNLKKFNRYPRAKRPNFLTLGVSSPFFMPWNELVNEWEEEFVKKYSTCNSSDTNVNSSVKCLYTLRDKNEIEDLQNIYKVLVSSKKHKDEAIYFQEMFSAKVQSLLLTQKINLKALILVQVECLTRGKTSNCSGIHLPNEHDLEVLKKNYKYFGPVEGKHDFATDLLPPKKRRKFLREVAKEEAKELDRPEVDSLLSSSEHKVIGYVSEGGYRRTCGKGFGIGHCTLTGFLTLLDLCANFKLTPTVLIREQHSAQYRVASIKIIDKSF